MKVLCIVPCGNKKIWDRRPDIGPQKAKNVYIGPLAIKCREYAERFFPSSWVILSAKYGFLFPEDLIPAAYDVTFNERDANSITLKELRIQAKTKGLYNYEKIVALGGKNYTAVVKGVFLNKEVYTPLSDCRGIGYMICKLNDAIKKGIPL